MIVSLAGGDDVLLLVAMPYLVLGSPRLFLGPAEPRPLLDHQPRIPPTLIEIILLTRYQVFSTSITPLAPPRLRSTSPQDCCGRPLNNDLKTLMSRSFRMKMGCTSASSLLRYWNTLIIPQYLLTLKRRNQRITISCTYSTPACVVGPYVTRQTMIERSWASRALTGTVHDHTQRNTSLPGTGTGCRTA